MCSSKLNTAIMNSISRKKQKETEQLQILNWQSEICTNFKTSKDGNKSTSQKIYGIWCKEIYPIFKTWTKVPEKNQTAAIESFQDTANFLDQC